MQALPPGRRSGHVAAAPHRRLDAHLLTTIRRQFLTRGEAPEDVVPAPILRSWRRCAALGLDMARRPQVEPLGRAELRERHERAERLVEAARGEIRLLHDEARAAGGIVVLTDADGLVLDALGSTEFAAKAARVALRPGVAWTEAATGTNAIGAALAERRDISVLGAEHFFDTHRILSCTAAPILDPCGVVIGALDLSSHVEVQHVHAPALVRRAVAAIEHRHFAASQSAHEIVHLHRDPAEIGGPREGLLAFEGDRLVGATRPALDLLDLDWDALGAARWNEIFAGPRALPGEVARMTTAAGRPLFGRTSRSAPAVPRRRLDAASPAARPSDAPPPARAEASILWDDDRARALARAVRLVDADVPVLVEGETGTGKEVFARALHAACRRRDRPFVAVNCAALPEGLIEAELFGYEEGAFTGARRRGSKGLLREAEGGVLFLDEIGDMPLALQARLLRALQEREVTPLGGGRPVAVDFALVCATHVGLAEAVERRAFRQDLYFRIAQYTVALAPLRGRPDLREVIERLWDDLAGATGARLAPEASARLVAADWPGNFRQLTATLRTLAILAEPGERLGLDALPADLRRPCDAPPTAIESTPTATDLAGVTRAAMREAIEAAGGNLTRAAARLGVHRSTLHRRLRSDA